MFKQNQEKDLSNANSKHAKSNTSREHGRDIVKMMRKRIKMSETFDEWMKN